MEQVQVEQGQVPVVLAREGLAQVEQALAEGSHPRRRRCCTSHLVKIVTHIILGVGNIPSGSRPKPRSKFGAWSGPRPNHEANALMYIGWLAPPSMVQCMTKTRNLPSQQYKK